jgi:hypothetical protein
MFTSVEIDNVRLHLGYPILQWVITLISDRLNDVSQLSLSGEVAVRNIIVNLNTVESQRITLRSQFGIETQGTSLAGTQPVRYYRGATWSELNNLYAHYQNQLAIATSLNVWNDVVRNRVVRS